MFVDTCCYNGEPVIFARLELLWDVVDRFVIVEALEPHNPAAPRKEAYYCDLYADKFEKYAEKIRWVKIDTFPATPPGWGAAQKVPWITAQSEDAWWREHYQRDCAGSMISPGDLVSCGDADELPDPDILARFRGSVVNQPVHLDMVIYSGSLAFQKKHRWDRAFVVTWTEGLSLTQLRSRAVYQAQRSGWHCTNFFSKDDLQRKIRSFAHVEFQHQDISDVAPGKDVYGRGAQEDCVPSTGDPPETLRNALARVNPTLAGI